MTQTTETPKPARRHTCWYCGTDMGPWTKFSCSTDTCGLRECDNAARDYEQGSRQDAHDKLDRDMGRN